ncbi:SAM-dependent methyltransferase [Hydromonas duriensis]|uniref:16S rRNA (Cytidine1402-2'-O)-methyltransferase n=1 Tax=Hydromonas duriensis TaxID=1527608 RepID=A0A4R6Y778_9BURK|nr:SAM-dependent methyltransferase [Hydromonas duriensis]TDR31167.1 16S rRNA (cytidine1402-2'-O)-methyltransferase [Hydromonas duriensis]
MAKFGTLYLIPNTLGSHDTLSAVLPIEVQRIAASCRHFVVENSKVARQFLKAVGISTPLQEVSMAELNVNTPDADIKALLTPLLAGQNVGLISDAGCPAVADPGARLVAVAHAAGISVQPLVGPSSILLALMGSGLNGQKFAFHGYLPIDVAQRQTELKKLEQESRIAQQTQMFIETPYRNMQLLEALCKTLNPQTKLCVAADLTLPSQFICMQSIEQWRKQNQNKTLPDLHKRPTLFLFLA